MGSSSSRLEIYFVSNDWYCVNRLFLLFSFKKEEIILLEWQCTILHLLQLQNSLPTFYGTKYQKAERYFVPFFNFAFLKSSKTRLTTMHAGGQRLIVKQTGVNTILLVGRQGCERKRAYSKMRHRTLDQRNNLASHFASALPSDFRGW